MRRIWIILIVIAVAGQTFAKDRPNVVIMLTDNVGDGDLGLWRGQGARHTDGTHRLIASQGL